MRAWFMYGAAVALGIVTACELAVRLCEWVSPDVDIDIDWGLPPL